MSVPDWVAPAGQIQRFRLGDRVQFQHVLEKHFEDHWGGWKRTALEEPREGLVVGMRFPYSGRVTPSYDSRGSFMGPPVYDEGYRRHDVTHRTYLVAHDLRKATVYVLSDDLEGGE